MLSMKQGSITLILGEPKAFKVKGEPRHKKCAICGENTKYEICLVCLPRGAALQVLDGTYEKLEYNEISPIIQDIYTILVMRGTQTFQRLAIEVNVSEPLLEIYIERFVKQRLVKRFVHRLKRGTTQDLITVTAKGKRASTTFQTLREFEERYGSLPMSRIESMAG